MTISRLRLEAGREVLVADLVVSDSNALVEDGLLLRPADAPIGVAVKRARDEGSATQLERESRVYRWLRRHLDDDLLTALPRYHGTVRSRRSTTAIVLERAEFSLDRLRLLGDSGDVTRSFARDLAVLAASAVIPVLEALAVADVAPNDRDRPLSHGDLKPANLVAVERDGVLSVVIADWGSAPLSHDRGAGDGVAAEAVSAALEAYDNDLRATGALLWALLHGTDTRSLDDRPPATPHLCESDPRCSARDDPEAQAVHRLAHGLRAAGEPDARRLVVDNEFPAVATLARRLLDRQRDRSTTPLLHRAMAANAASPFLFPPRPPRSAFTAPDREPRIRRAVVARVSGWYRELRRSGAAALVTATLGGFVLGIVAGWMSRLQPMPYPSVDSDRALSIIVATLYGTLAVVGVILGFADARRRRARGLTRRVSWPVRSVAAIGAIVGAEVMLLVVGHPELPLLVYSAVVVAAFAFAPLVNAEPAPEPRLSRVDRRDRWMPIIAAVGSVALVVVLLGPLGHLTGPGPVPIAYDVTVDGMPSGLPSFVDPSDVALADDGTVAVLERYEGTDASVWIIPPSDGVPTRDTKPWLAFRTTPALDVPIDPARATRLADAILWASGSRSGDEVTSITALDFLDDEVLVVSGPEGLTRLRLNRDARSSSAERLTSQLADSTQIVTAGGSVYAIGGRTTEDVGRSVPWCDDVTQQPDYVKRLWKVDAGGAVTQVTWPSDTSGRCVYSVDALVDYDGGAGAMAWATPPENIGATSTEHAGRYFVAAIDGTERTWLPFTRDRSTDEGHPLSDLDVGDIAVAGGRLFATVDDCLYGYSVPSGDPLTDVAIDTRTAYSGDDRSDCGGLQANVIDPVVEVDPPGDVSPDESGGAVVGPENSDSVAADCAKPLVGTPQIARSSWRYNPIASDSAGTLLLVADAGIHCSATLWRLADGAVDWQPTRSLATQNANPTSWSAGATTTMVAVAPQIGDAGLTWTSPRYGQLSLGTGQRNQYLGPYYRWGPVKQIDFGDVIVTAAATLVDSVPVTGITFTQRGASHAGLRLSGITDISRVGDRLVIARCGQVLSLDPLDPVFARNDGVWYGGDLAGLPIDVVAGSTTVGDPATDPDSATGSDCPPLASAASDYRSILADAPMSPIAVSGAQREGAYSTTYVVADAGMYDGRTASRIRVIDPASDTIATIGHDDGREGDLLPLGLLATDVAMSPDGRILVTTRNEDGIGPVLLFDHAGRSVLRVPEGIAASGAVWFEKHFVVTDEAGGSLITLVLDGD
jgi:hypothetical protein